MDYRIRCFTEIAGGGARLAASFRCVSYDMAKGFLHLYLKSAAYDVVEIEEIGGRCVETWERPEGSTGTDYERTW